MSSQEMNINDININRVSHTKFAGVIIDKKMSWAYHANYMQNKTFKGSSYYFFKARRNLPKSYLICLYNSFILPYLIYCVEVWGNTSKYILDPVIQIQKIILIIIAYSS